MNDLIPAGGDGTPFFVLVSQIYRGAHVGTAHADRNCAFLRRAERVRKGNSLQSAVLTVRSKAFVELIGVCSMCRNTQPQLEAGD